MSLSLWESMAKNIAYPLCGLRFLNNHNRGGKKSIATRQVMRGGRWNAVKCLVLLMQLLAEGLREVKKKRGGGISLSLCDHMFFYFSLSEGYEGERRKILFGRCALRNPCRHKSWHHQVRSAAVSPSSPTSLHMCFLVLTADWEREIKLEMSGLVDVCRRVQWDRNWGGSGEGASFPCAFTISWKNEKDTRRLKNQARSIVRGQMTTSDLHPNQPLSCTSIIHT